MSKIPTAKKFLIQNSSVETYYEEHIKMMKEYGELIRKATLEEAAEKATAYYYGADGQEIEAKVDRTDILELENSPNLEIK